MAETRSGIFTQKEFNYRRSTLRIAPDAYIIINGAYGARVVSPCFSSGKQTLDVRGGVTSVSISAAVSPAGASRATVEVIAPQFKGLHEDYYITLPNGTKIPFFIPMQEIKIFMKGRFLEAEYNYEPRYYPVFWGMITTVSENYSGGVNTFSITCEDMLSWWKYQKITLRPSSADMLFGGTVADSFATVFKNLNAWEIIYTLFMDTFFIHKYDGGDAFSNFLYPKLSSIKDIPEVEIKKLRDSMGGIVRDIMGYWEGRFGFDAAARSGDPNKIPLEIYGLNGGIDLKTFREKVIGYLEHPDTIPGVGSDASIKMTLDYNLLAGVMPFASFSNWGSGSESLISTKLDIANTVCEQTNMEFFVDTNGHFVFKPPFYNLDVATGDVPHYKIGPEDIVNFNANHDSNNIVNYLSVTGPMYQGPDSLDAVGFHIDFESIKRYGIHFDEVSVRYGKTSRILKLIACAEMARRNGMAYTGSVTIPLRPEIRLGYPVYLEHIDAFYYVTGVNHSINFGQSATTDLSLQYKRERMFDDGSFNIPGSSLGSVLSKTVLAYNNVVPVDPEKSATADAPLDVAAFIDSFKGKLSPEEILDKVNDIKKIQVQSRAGVRSGPNFQGFYKIRKSNIKSNSQGIINKDSEDAISLNELVMITGDTVPYTDINGYKHIGAFPYGANLVMMKNEQMVDITDPATTIKFATNSQIGAGGIPQYQKSVPVDLVSEESKNNLQKLRDMSNWANDLVENLSQSGTPVSAEEVKTGVSTQLSSPSPNTNTVKPVSN